MAETLSVGISPEIKRQETSQQVVFISGATGTNDGLRAINSTLQNEFGRDKVTVYNSVLFGDKSSPNRFVEMGRSLKSKIENGKTTILAHSFGAAETIEAFKEIEKHDPNFFKNKENLDNINLILVSPAGFFKNWRQGIRYGAKYAKLGVQEAGKFFGKTLPGKSSVLQGIVSASVVPSHVLERGEMIDSVQAMAGKISHMRSDVLSVDANADRDYAQYMDFSEKQKLREIDARLAEYAYADQLTWRQRMSARKALRQRGRLTRKVVKGALENKYADDYSDPIISNIRYGRSRSASQARRRLMLDTFLRGKVLEKMNSLQNAGLKINMVVPEYDTLMTVDNAKQFLQGRDDRLVVTPLSTHMAPWGPQPGILAELAKRLSK